MPFSKATALLKEVQPCPSHTSPEGSGEEVFSSQALSFKHILTVVQQHPGMLCWSPPNLLCCAKFNANALVSLQSRTESRSGVIQLRCPIIQAEEATVPVLFLHHCLADRALSQESYMHLPRRRDNPVFAVGGTSWAHWVLRKRSFLPVESWPTGRKELEMNGGRTERSSCSPSQAHATGPTSLPKFKEKNLARLVSIANPARCQHDQIILLFSHFFFSKGHLFICHFCLIQPQISLCLSPWAFPLYQALI